MTLRHLKIFVAVCEYGGITKASEALHIAQPSVSLTISQMEKYYKVTLFERINQRLILTEIGKVLLIKAKESLRSFHDFEVTARQGSENPTLHIGSSLTLGKTVIPLILKKLKKEIPKLNIYVTIDKTSLIEKKIENGKLDFCIVEGKPVSQNIKSYDFGKDTLVAVCSKNYNVKNQISAKELTSLPLLLREKGSASRSLLEKVLEEKNLNVNPFFESSSNQCIVVSLQEGLGVSVLPFGIVEPLLKRGTLKIINIEDLNFDRNHYIVIHKNKKMTPSQKKAFDICLNLNKEYN